MYSTASEDSPSGTENAIFFFYRALLDWLVKWLSYCTGVLSPS